MFFINTLNVPGCAYMMMMRTTIESYFPSSGFFRILSCNLKLVMVSLLLKLCWQNLRRDSFRISFAENQRFWSGQTGTLEGRSWIDQPTGSIGELKRISLHRIILERACTSIIYRNFFHLLKTPQISPKLRPTTTPNTPIRRRLILLQRILNPNPPPRLYLQINIKTKNR